VPATWAVGRLAIGANKYSGSVKKYKESPTCVNVLQGTTPYSIPKREWHFQTTHVA